MQSEREQWQAIKAVFYATLEKPAEQRAAFLKEACRENAALLREVQKLLHAHETAGDFLEPTSLNLKSLLEEPSAPDPMIGAHIGPYRI